MSSPDHSPTLEIRHKTQQSHDSGAYIDWNSDSGSPTRKNSGELSMSYIAEGEFVTVVSVDGDSMTSQPSQEKEDINNEDAAFVTVLSIGDDQQQEDMKTIMNVSELTSELGSESSSKISTSGSDETHSKCDVDEEESEEVLVYRLPGERLGFGLKFEGGTKTHELVRRLFIQSCAPDSPASRARCSWGELGEGDEILEIDGASVSAMTRLDCVRCLKESHVVIKLRVQHADKFTEIPLNNDESNLPLVVSEIKKTPPSPPPIPPRKSPRKTPVLPPKDAVPIGPPSGFGDESARSTPPTPRLRQPPQPEVYLDLLAQEELAAMNAESESDDTGSSISTVVDRSLSNSSFSEIRATTPIDLAKVLSPFEQLERELSADAEYLAESSSLSETPSFDETLDSLPNDEIEEITTNLSNTGDTLQPPEFFKDTDKENEIKNSEQEVINNNDYVDNLVPILPPKPAPRKDGSPSKFKSGKKRPPPPPPPRQDRPQAPQPTAAPRPPQGVVVVPEPLDTPPSSPEAEMREFKPPVDITTHPSLLSEHEDGVVDAAFIITPTRDDLLLDQRDDMPRTQDVPPFTPFHWGVVTSLATIGEDEEETSIDVAEITICEATDEPPCHEVQVIVAAEEASSTSVNEEPIVQEPVDEPNIVETPSIPATIELYAVDPIIEDPCVTQTIVQEEVLEEHIVESISIPAEEPVVEDQIEEITIEVPVRPEPSLCKIMDNEVSGDQDEVTAIRTSLLTIDEEEVIQDDQEKQIHVQTSCETSEELVVKEEIKLVSVIRKSSSTELINNIESVEEVGLIVSCEGEEGGHAPPPPLSTRTDTLLTDAPTTTVDEGPHSTPVLETLVAEMPAQETQILQPPQIAVEEIIIDTTCEQQPPENAVDVIKKDTEVVAEKNLGPASLPIFSNVESCNLNLGSQQEDHEENDMDGLLSLQHPLPFVGKHQNGGGVCTIEDSTSPPPSFSRLPPDGHEFPPNYIEPCPEKLASLLNTSANTTDRRSPKWRQDEKSQKSVRDKIALFSTEKSSEQICPEIINTTTTALHNRFRSTEDVSLRHNGGVINNNNNIVMERAVSTIDLSPQEPMSPVTNIPAPRYSTLPRKPTVAPVAPVNTGIGRTMSFSGVTPSLHTRSQSLIDVAGQRKPATSISALLEQRRRGFSKLRGLVIPERAEIPAPATVVDLPEIRSRDIPLLKPAVRPTSLLEPAIVNNRNLSNNKTTSLLPALPTMPKYSPAFKRKSFTVFGDKQENQEITTSKINQPIKPIETYNKSFNQYYSKSNGNTNGISFVTTIQEPKSLESLSSPRSDISFDELPSSVGTTGASEDGDSDSAVSSGRSSPPDTRSGDLDGDEPGRNSLRRTLSSETASSTASTASSTLTSGSDGCGRRVLKAQSVEAVNRKNVLASARNSNGRPVGLGSPLIQRRFEDDDDSSGHYEMHATEETYYSSNTDGENEQSTKTTYVVHTVVNGMNNEDINDDREIKVAYVDEICEVEFMPTSENAPVSPPMVTPRKVMPEIISPPAISPRKTLADTPAPALRVTELRAKLSAEPPNSLPIIIPPETIVVAPVAPSRPPPAVPPRSSPVEPTEAPPMSPPPVIPAPQLPAPLIAAPPNVSPPMSPPPVPVVKPQDTVDAPVEKPKERWSTIERKYESTRTSVTSPRSSRQEETKTFKDIAERWQLMSVDAPPKAPTPMMAPRTTPEKPGRRSASVTDIRRAFERSPQTAALTVTVPNHARVSSLDSSASEETSSGPSAPASALLSSANSMEQLGSISSLASSTSIISQQELQGLLDEAAQEEGAQGEMLVLVLHRDSLTSSVGITLAGGADYEARDITVHKVLAGSPADRDGRVQKGDRILSINGRSMKNLTHREALTILKAPRPEAVLVIARGRSEAVLEEAASPAPSTRAVSAVTTPEQQQADLQPTQVTRTTSSAPVLVNMTKDGAGLGFSLEGGRDSPLGDRPLTIKKIFTGGAAEKTGQLSAGDQLLAVNGTDVSSMSRIEAWNLMKRLPLGPVTLLVRSQ